jgi:hypothetical protein
MAATLAGVHADRHVETFRRRIDWVKMGIVKSQCADDAAEKNSHCAVLFRFMHLIYGCVY